jgi:hypothetical protein
MKQYKINSAARKFLGCGILSVVMFGCGDKEETPPAPVFTIATGDVDRYTAGPEYTLTNITPGEADGDNIPYTITGTMTEWHELRAVQVPADCAGTVTFTWDAANTQWTATIAKSKVESPATNCAVTVIGGMGGTVPWAWVKEIFSNGVPNGQKNSSGGDAKTAPCTECHTDTGQGNFAMTDAEGVIQYSIVTNNKESNDASAAVSAMYGSDSVTVGESCTAPSASTIDRIKKGDPYNSRLVQLTRVTFSDTSDKTTGKAVDATGTQLRLCDSSEVKSIYMPRDKEVPITGNDSTALPEAVHAQLARWVLQGAQESSIPSFYEESGNFSSQTSDYVLTQLTHNLSQIWYSKDLLKLFETQPFTAPVGTMAVKQWYSGGVNTGTPTIGAMVKMPAGYDPDNGDWYYEQLDGSGGIAISGKTNFCQGCHGKSDYTNTDFLAGTGFKD